MTTMHQTADGIIAITKGAVHVLFNQLDESQKLFVPEFEKQVNSMAEKSYRVLGFAIKNIN